jgi:hypothetical protein
MATPPVQTQVQREVRQPLVQPHITPSVPESDVPHGHSVMPEPVPGPSTLALLSQLRDLEASVNRLPSGQVAFTTEIALLRNALSTPGADPSPADMMVMQGKIADLSTRIGDLDRPLPVVLPVMMEDIEQRLADAARVVATLKTGRDAFTDQLQGLQARQAALVAPHTQADLDTLNMAVMAVVTVIENDAGRQGV